MDFAIDLRLRVVVICFKMILLASEKHFGASAG